ncbi:MAG: hypothetical protein ACFFBD_18915 [Candidatus Hodarchaeota archaeon]
MKKVEGLACPACGEEDNIIEISPRPGITLDVAFSARVDVQARVCPSCGHIELFLNENSRQKVLNEVFKAKQMPVVQHVLCLKCGGSNNPGSKFCVFCGQKV